MIVLTTLVACNSEHDQPTISSTAPNPVNVQPTKIPLTPKVFDIGDGGFLSKQPCGPPCFFGITPDLTTEDATLDFLKDKSVIANCTSWDTRPKGGDRGIRCTSDSLVFTFLNSNFVDMISFAPSKKFTVGEVIALYGNPDGIFVDWEIDDFGNIVWVAMDVYYYDIRTIVKLPIQYSSSYIVTEYTEAIGIMYRSDSNYERFAIYAAKPWEGFGEYPASSIP